MCLGDVTSSTGVWCRTVNIMDNMLHMMEKYANNLEELVEEKTHQYMEEKRKADLLLHSMMPASVLHAYTLGEVCGVKGRRFIVLFK